MRRVAFLGLFLAVLGFCFGPLAWGQNVPAPTVLGAGSDPGTELRLVPMPEGVGGAAVRASFPDGTPADVRALDPMVMRGVRLLPVVISREAAARGVSLELVPDKAAPAVALNEAARHCGRGFFDSMRPFLAGDAVTLGGPDKADDAALEGTYLIITAPEYRDAIEPLAQWKREKGLQVRVATTNETGVDRNQIHSWIGNLYWNDPRPPQFVLLVGDVADVPAFDYHGVVSDLPYVLHEGNDILPDMLIGRLSVSDLSQAETVVAKILRHESKPLGEDGSVNGEWMGRALVVGADYASTTPRAVSRWIRKHLLDDGFSSVDSVYFPPHQGSGTALIRARINAGVSLITYRGWAYGPQGWQPPTFISGDIHGLSNGWMLPAVFSFVCLNNKFDEPECMGEAWLRAGTPEQPKGGVAFIGNSEHWSHTRFNDAMAIGAMTGIHQDGIRRLGDILDYAKMDLLRQFPLEIPYSSEGGESVEFYFHIYNLLGDPEMELWMGPPRGIAVTHPDTLDLGANQVDVQVHLNPGGSAVEGVRVALSQGDQVLGCAWTDGLGLGHVPVEGLVAGVPVKVTVTGKNCAPYQGGIVPAALPGRPSLAGSTVREDGGGGTLETRTARRIPARRSRCL